MSKPHKTWLVSGGEYVVYSTKIDAASFDEAVEIAKARFAASAWDGWDYCGSERALIQNEGEAMS